jgi:hypothetical protein
MGEGVLKYVFNLNMSLHVLALSASFCLEEQSKFLSIMLDQPSDWGPMARCSIIFDVSVLDIVASSMANEIVFYSKLNPTWKVIVYTNRKSSAKGQAGPSKESNGFQFGWW